MRSARLRARSMAAGSVRRYSVTVLATGDDDLVGGAGVPADPDACLGEVGFGQQGDIGDEGAQQPFAVPGGGGGGVPQAGHVCGERFEFGPGRAVPGAQRLGLGEGSSRRRPAPPGVPPSGLRGCERRGGSPVRRRGRPARPARLRSGPARRPAPRPGCAEPAGRRPRPPRRAPGPPLRG